MIAQPSTCTCDPTRVSAAHGLGCPEHAMTTANTMPVYTGPQMRFTHTKPATYCAGYGLRQNLKEIP